MAKKETAESVKINKAAAVELLVSMHYNTAPQFSAERLIKKFNQLAEKDLSEVECSNRKLLDKIMSAIENKEPVEIVEEDEAKPAKKSDKKAAADEKPAKKAKKPADDEEEDDEEEEEAKPAKKSKKAAKPAADEDDEEDEEEEDEKPAKKSKPKKGEKPAAKADKKAAKPKGKGVIDVIRDVLVAASEKKPVTKDAIVEKLEDVFPDRETDAMKGTVNVQVPSRIGRERGITVHKNEKGYWATEGASSKAEKSEKVDKKASKKSKKADDDDEDDDE